MGTLRRALVLAALMFWQGGFTFYVAVVVPVGTSVLGSALRQGFVTRQVTVWLNLAGAIALGILALDLLSCRETSRKRAWVRRGCWLVMVTCQALLTWLHRHLDSLMEERGRIVLDPEAFYYTHRIYLWTHTIQWACGLVFVALMLLAWRGEDRTS